MPPRQRAALAPDEAYARLLDDGGFERIRARYEALLDAVAPLQRTRPGFRVLSHTYCRLRRIGVPARARLSSG